MSQQSSVQEAGLIDNKSKAIEQLNLAKQWFQANDMVRASKFAKKSYALNPTDEAEQIMDQIKQIELGQSAVFVSIQDQNNDNDNDEKESEQDDMDLVTKSPKQYD